MASAKWRPFCLGLDVLIQGSFEGNILDVEMFDAKCVFSFYIE